MDGKTFATTFTFRQVAGGYARNNHLMMTIFDFILLILSIFQIILGSRDATIAPQPVMAYQERFFLQGS